jgi:hypothetical protein
MSRVVIDDEQWIARDRESLEPIIHKYPPDPIYRKSGQSPPQIGDVAYCGWVKRTPPVAFRRDAPRCVVCADLAGSRSA